MILKILFTAYHKLLFEFKSHPKKGHGIHSPFVFDLVQKVLKTGLKVKNRKIEQLRKDLLKNAAKISYTDYGAGSNKIKGSKLSINSIVKTFSLSRKEGAFLQRMINFITPGEVVEFGTSLGFGTMYMASAEFNPTIHSVEANTDSAKLAIRNFNFLRLKNIRVYNQTFDNFIQSTQFKVLVPKMVVLDGNHTYEATIKYYRAFKKIIPNNAVIIINDIYWSKGMLKAWNEIIIDADATITIDIFDFGLAFFREGVIKQHFRIKY